MRQYIPIRLASVRLDCGVGCGSVGLSEVAVTGVCDVDSTRGIGGDELNRDGLGLNIAFVAEVVYVAAAGIDKTHSFCVDVRFAVGIVPFIVGDGSGGDDDEAMTRVRVPAGASAGRPDVVLDVDI